MSGTTSKGYPYVLGSDSADTIDDTSLALANKLEAVVPFAMASGQVVVTLTAAASGFTAITFPGGRFTVAPNVIVSQVNAPSGTQKFVCRCINSTTSGASVYAYTGDGSTATGSATIAWWAVQMTTASANG
jgi:hypothetical protein